MVKFRDLSMSLSFRSIVLSESEKQILIQRAAREVAERSMVGAIIVPLCLAMAVFSSGYVSHSPITCFLLALLMSVSAGGRCLAINRIKHQTIAVPPLWIQVFYWSCVSMAAVWGFLTAIFIHTYLADFPVWLILLLSAGIGAGAMINFCIWRDLAVTFLLLLFIPGVIVGLFLQRSELLPAVAAIGFFVLYLLAQIKRWNFNFWDSLITAYLFERQADKLAEANTKLAEVVAKEKKTSREVESSRLKVRELFNLTNDAIVICGLDGSVLDINLAMAELFAAVGDGNYTSLPLEIFCLLDSNSLTVQEHWEDAVDGIDNDFECMIERSGGRSPLYLHANFRRVTWQDEQIVFVTLRDIRTQKRMEEALKRTKKFLAESEGYLQAILSKVELPIYCKDLSGRYLTANRPFEELCCKKLEDFLGKTDIEIFQENIGRFLSYRDTEIIETGESVELEGTFTFGDTEKNLLVHKFPLKESGGSVYATAGICTDVSTMKKALHTAQIANEAKSEFLASMSHELRTPMHSILSVARLGLKKVDRSSPEKLESYFKMIVTSGDQLLQLLSDLLDLSTLESSRGSYSLGDYDLAEDLRQVVGEFMVMMDEREISLTFHFDGGVAMARYDKTKLFQVVRNLLANAMKFTSSRKEIQVRLEQNFLEINGNQQAAWKVMVIDQGIGVEKDELESVFGKFVKGSKSYVGAGGVGLGLSICKRIVEDHQGHIWAEQNETEGTTFCFLLPASDPFMDENE